MRYTRYIADCKKPQNDFIADIQNRNQRHCNRQSALPYVHKRRQQNHHKDDSACADHCSPGKEKHVDQPRYERGDDYNKAEPFAAVFFFDHRPDGKNHHEVTDIVAQVGMYKHMRKQPDVLHGVFR